MSNVIFKRIDKPSYESIFEAIKYIIENSGITSGKIGKKCFIKINAMSREVLPGRNTSPWVLEAAVSNLTKKFQSTEFIIGDCDVAGFKQFRQACRNWGYDKIAEKYGINIVNLSEDKLIEIETQNPACPRLEVSKTIISADSIINIPVLKTHVLSGITCCLKNHWGMLPRFRYQYHTRMTEVISEINKQIKHTIFNIVDATICMEGSGPKTGKPKICSVLFGGADRVAVDMAVLKYAGIPVELAEHVTASEKKGIGSVEFKLSGDEFIPDKFILPELGNDLVSYIERMIRSIPIIGKIMYLPFIAKILGFIGTMYNEIVWFNVKGRKYINEIIRNSDYYSEYFN